MQFPKSQSVDRDNQLLPLVNIVFLLLIFFLIAGQITRFEPIATHPPESSSDTAAHDDELIVSMDADGKLALNGEIMSAPAVIEAIELSPQQASVVRIKADAQVKAVRVIEMMEQLRNAGSQQINLLTARRSPDEQLDERF